MMPDASVRVIDTSADGPKLPIVQGRGNSRVLLWPGNGSVYRSFQSIELDAGSTTLPLKHRSDCVYYVIGGTGRIRDEASGESSALGEGAMVHIDAGDTYVLSGDADGFKLIGGPCPPDPDLYATITSAGENA